MTVSHEHHSLQYIENITSQPMQNLDCWNVWKNLYNTWLIQGRSQCPPPQRPESFVLEYNFYKCNCIWSSLPRSPRWPRIILRSVDRWSFRIHTFCRFWLIGLKSQWAYLIINHKLCTICLWTHSDGAHGGRYTLPLPTPTHPYPYLPPPTPTPTYPTHPYPYLPPTHTYPYWPLPLPTPTTTHPYYK